MTPRTAIETLAAFVVEADSDRHPAQAVERAKHAFLDTISCAVLGSRSDATEAVIAMARDFGTGNVPLIGRAETLPAPLAALANGASAHAFDLDDCTFQANDHPSAVLVPAVLAAADGTMSGRALLDAYLIGLEVIFRLGESVNMGHYNLGWHTTSTLDSLGATAAVCRLRGLGARETAAALSLTTSMGSGYVSQFGTDAKPLHAGLSAETGLVASGLASGGASAYLGALDGPVSFRTLMTPDGTAHFTEMLAKLGAPWGILEHGLAAKVYPSCGYTHRAVDCAVRLHRALGIRDASEVASASVRLLDFHLAILPFGVPENRTEALFSTAYCVAVALATGENRIEDFSDAAIRRADIRDLTARIAVTARNPKRPEVNFDLDDPDTVAVELRDGRRAEEAVAIWTGAPGRDLDGTQFLEKALDCVVHGGHAHPDAAVGRLSEALDGLERANSLDPLMEAVSLLRTEAEPPFRH